MKLTNQQLDTLRRMTAGITAINQYGGKHSLRRSIVSELYRSGLIEYSNPYNARLTEAGRAALAEADKVRAELQGF